MKQKIQPTILAWLRLYPTYTVVIAYSIILVFCFFPLFNGTASLNWDAFDLWLPWKHFIVDELYNGQLPLWNPYFKDGFPQHGDTMTWYPVSWLFGFLFGGYNLFSLNLEYAIHLLIAGTGMYSLSKQFSNNQKINFLIGLSFMLSGFMIGNAQHVSWVISAAWLPWYFLSLHQLRDKQNIKQLLFFILTGYFLFTGGYLAIFFVIFYLTIFYFTWLYFNDRRNKIFWRFSINLLIGVLVIGLLSLPLLLSAYEVFPFFNRFDPEKLHEGFNVNLGATPWNGVLSILFPLGSGVYNIPEFKFGTFSTFFGLIPFLLLLAKFKTIYTNRKLLLLFTVAFLSLMCSMGEMFPFRKIISYLPLLDLFRYPTLFRLFYIFISLVLLAMVLEKSPLKTTKKLEKRWFCFIGFVFIVTALIIFLDSQKWDNLAVYFKNIFYLKPLEGLSFIQRMGINFLLLGTVFLGLSFWWFRRKHLAFYRFILITWFLEVILVAGTSAPHTVYHSVNVPWANHIIQSQPIKPNPFIPNHTDQEALKWGKYIGFSWKSKTFYTKQFSSLWFNPLRIKTHPETKNYLEIELTDTTPFIGLIKKNSLGKYQVYEDKNIQFKVITNQHWRIQYSTDISEERFLFLKQRFIPGWQAFSNQDTTEIKQTQNGYMLIDLNTVKNNTFDLIYDSNKYKISFWISLCLLGIILLLNFSLSSYKLEWGGFFIIVLFIAFVYNQHRFCSFTKNPITKENSIENVDFFNTNFYLLNYWKSKRDTIYIPQNVPKTDKDIAFIYFNYPNFVKNICVGKSEYIMRTKREKPTTIEEIEATTDASHFHYNLYPLVKTQQLYRNVLLFRLNYLASPDSKLRLWIVHKRAGEWRDGETWTLSTNSLSNTEKQLVVTKDISAFDLMPGDELTLFVWGDADSLFNWNNFSIHVLPF